MTGMNGAHAASAELASVSRRWRMLLVAAAALEFLGGVRDLPILFGDLSEVPGPGLGGGIIIAKIALQPILGLAALLCAWKGRLRESLLAMAAIILVTWLNFLPSVTLHGLDFRGKDAFISLHMILQIVLAPFLAAAVAALAIRNRVTPTAIALAILPTVVGVLGVVAFAISVAIYGF
jgi:hypothetical protein